MQAMAFKCCASPSIRWSSAVLREGINITSLQIIPEELIALLLRRLLDWLGVGLREAYDALRQHLSLHNGALNQFGLSILELFNIKEQIISN